jgi:hypothetical protein
MDSLFSNIQKTLQNNNKNTLLKNQQISQDKINELLNQSVDALVCGPTCQKQKVTDELRQKYIDAETNVNTAPIELERTKKNYYVFTEGRTYYDNMLEEELIKKSQIISQLLSENFNDEVSSAITMNEYLNIALINSDYTKDLLKYYVKQNEEITLKLKDNHGDILTNDRKTYYEVQELERLELWYKIWFRLFYILFISFLICWLVCESTITWPIKLILTPLIGFYPYYIDYVLRAIYKFWADLYKSLPKNVYNNL